MSAPEGSPAPSPRRGRPAQPSVSSVAELAAYLNLSSWTISRAINGHPEVNPRTRERIFQAMEHLGFRPNPLARGLRRQKTGFVGICFMGLNKPILNTKIYHLQEFLRRHHLRGLLEINNGGKAEELRAIEDFRRIQVEGVVLAYSQLTERETQEALGDLPYVHVDPVHPQAASAIALDRHTAMRALFDHLYDLGHRLFGLLGISRSEIWRWPGLCEAARQRGLDPGEVFPEIPHYVYEDYTLTRGRRMAEAAFLLRPRPTAFIANNDFMALGAIQAAREAGLSVPGDVSVTGFDNLDLAHELTPTLTTIEQNPADLMQRAGELLLEQIRTPNRRHPFETLAPTFVLGDSTGVAPGQI